MLLHVCALTPSLFRCACPSLLQWASYEANRKLPPTAVSTSPKTKCAPFLLLFDPLSSTIPATYSWTQIYTFNLIGQQSYWDVADLEILKGRRWNIMYQLRRNLSQMHRWTTRHDVSIHPRHLSVLPTVMFPTWHPDDGCGLLPHIVWTFRPFVSLQSAGGCFRFLVPPSGTTISTSHLRRHSRFSDNDWRSWPFCFPVPTKTLSYDSCVTVTIHHYCLDICGHCNNSHYLGH